MDLIATMIRNVLKEGSFSLGIMISIVSVSFNEGLKISFTALFSGLKLNWTTNENDPGILAGKVAKMCAVPLVVGVSLTEKSLAMCVCMCVCVCVRAFKCVFVCVFMCIMCVCVHVSMPCIYV